MADKGNTIGEAYLQIKPSMDGVPEQIQEAMGDAGEKSSGSFGRAFTTGLKVVGGAALSTVSAATAGVYKLTMAAKDGFADYEQLVGGVETLFGDSADIVMQNANEAFETAGVSANKYMETVTSFSASLLQSVGGNTEEAANMADMAMRDMSDNANKMGTDISSIMTAYQGFSKQNYTMLDNLKLGYGGTKEEMERLLRDAEELEGYIEGSFDASNFDDIVEAINIIQTNMGITGTTAKEASETISGSFASLQSAWSNLVTGFANPDADLGTLIGNVVDTGTTYLENLIPTLLNALSGITDAIPRVVSVITQNLPGLLEQILPSLLSAAQALVKAIVASLPSILDILLSELPSLINMVVDTILQLTPMLVGILPTLLLALVDGLIDNLPMLIPATVDAILTICEKLTDPTMIIKLTEAAIELMIALGQGLINAIPQLIERIPVIINNVVEAIVGSAGLLLGPILEVMFNLVSGIGEALSYVLSEAYSKVLEWWDGVTEWFMGLVDAVAGFFQPVVDTVVNIWNSFMELFSPLINAFSYLFETIFQAIHILTERIFTAIGDKISSTWNAIMDFVVPILTRMSEFISGVLEKIKAFFSSIWDGIKEKVTNVLNTIIEFVRGIFDSMVSAVEGPLTSLKEIVGNIFDSIKETISNLIGGAKSWGKDLIDNFVGGIKDKISAVSETITDVANTIRSIIGFSEPEDGPLSNFHTFAPDLMELFAQGIRDNMGVVQSAFGSMAGMIQTDFTTQIMPTTYSELATADNSIESVNSATDIVGGGDWIFPLYFGQERIDTAVITAQQRHNVISGGRS